MYGKSWSRTHFWFVFVVLGMEPTVFYVAGSLWSLAQFAHLVSWPLFSMFAAVGVGEVAEWLWGTDPPSHVLASIPGSPDPVSAGVSPCEYWQWTEGGSVPDPRAPQVWCSPPTIVWAFQRFSSLRWSHSALAESSPSVDLIWTDTSRRSLSYSLLFRFLPLASTFVITFLATQVQTPRSPLILPFPSIATLSESG